MRRRWILALLAALVLSGCTGTDAPARPNWDESWVSIGEIVAIEPLEDFVLHESNDVLSISGLYYAAWTCGEGEAYVNADGDDAMVYDAQIYVLLEECGSPDAAAETVESWMDREKQSYETGAETVEVFAAQEFTVLPLHAGREGNPYGRGAAAFAARERWAISVELVCSEGFGGEPQPLLARFLSGFHYGEE